MIHKEELRQTLLELHYGLLEGDEAAELRAKIESDVEVAKLWAETLTLAGQFASAAKLADSSAAEDTDSNLHTERRIVEKRLPQKPVKEDTDLKSRRRIYRAFMGTLATYAALMAVFLIGNFLFKMPSSPRPAIQIAVESLNRASINEFSIFTSALSASSADRPSAVASSLSLAVRFGDIILHEANLVTDEKGYAEFKIPPNIVLPKNAQLEVMAANTSTSISVPLQPTRCLTYLTSDKPVYRPGETIHYRSLTLERQSMRPTIDLPIRFELINPSGAVATGSANEGVTDRGVGNGEIEIPATAPGGTYTLKVRNHDGFFPEETLEIQVRNYRAPRFKKDLEFKKRSYGPGDIVSADFEAIRAEGGAVANKNVLINAKVDGEEIYRHEGLTDAAGGCAISFKLPEHISKGAGQLSVAIDDGGTEEVQSKTIPIQIGKVEVNFYPEGGYLVDGLRNRVYFAARNPLGEPIHIEGEVLDRDGKLVGNIKTVRDGMGRFEFTPKMNQQYSLKVTSPAAINNSPRLPNVVKSLPVLSTGKGVFGNAEPVVMDIQTAEARPVVVRAACRGKLVANTALSLKAGKSRIEIPLPASVEGVVRLTILEPAGDDESDLPLVFDRPLVERLVYRECKHKLNVSLDGSRSDVQRSPGESVILNLQVTDENGVPTPAVLGVAVVDDAALSLREDEVPNMRTHFVLTSEIEKPEDLEHANFYLSGSKESKQSLDLLLGTQGWRRFIQSGLAQNSGMEGLAFNEQIARLLDLNGSSDQPTSVVSKDTPRQSWRDYSSALNQNLSDMLTASCWLVLPVVLVMLVTFLFRPKSKLATSVGMWLAMLAVPGMMLGTAMIVGCSADTPQGEPQFAKLKATPITAASPDVNETFADASGIAWAKAIDGAQMEPIRAREHLFGMQGDFDDAALQTLSQRFDDAWGNRNPAGDGMGGPGVDPHVGFGDTAMGGMGPGRWATANPGITINGQILNADQVAQLLRGRGMDADALTRQLLDSLRFPVREYAHQHVSTRTNVREDFAETLFWQPLMITDSRGKAEIRFELSDSVTTFRVTADAHTNDGRIGSGGGEVISRLPLQIEPKMPLAVTNGDRIDLPVAIINTTDKEIPLSLSIKTGDAFKLEGPDSRELSLTRKQRTRDYFSLEVVSADHNAKTDILLTGQSEKSGQRSGPQFNDSITRSVQVSPSGYPIRESVSGVLNNKVSVILPDTSRAVPGSLAIRLNAFPSPLADLMSGVESILQEPHGCFEQTSATNYPNTMVLQYLKSAGISKPKATRKAKSMLERGYGKLTSFECRKLGFEWFGHDPGHEALSAFGLMQFADMAKIMDVDEEMMLRTRKWLISRRDGQGSFQRNPRHLHVWSVNQNTVDAYILWALSEADVASGNPQRTASELGQELNELERIALASQDPYVIALAAATLMNVDQTTAGNSLLQKLASLQKDSGALVGNTTVTQSGGISLKAETTAMAVLAWSKSDKYHRQMKAAVQWLASNRQGSGGFGSTQATVLALKAMVAYAETATNSIASSVLYVKQKGNVIGQVKIPENAKAGSTLSITGLGAKVDPEVTELELVAEGVTNLPFSIDVVYHTATPPSDSGCPFEIETSFADSGNTADIESGETIQVDAVLKNTTSDGQPMALMTIGLPGGVEPRADQLDELKEAGMFDFYEIRPREVTCYWRTIAPNEEKKVSFDVTAEVAGKYTGPASKAYLYYTAEQKTWTEPLTVEIQK